ncbi:hypothetical protein KKE60_06855 [Patescibacteria group bacterium]|nr:hypothetical protein [Patescibacteria group bacterium]
MYNKIYGTPPVLEKLPEGAAYEFYKEVAITRKPTTIEKGERFGEIFGTEIMPLTLGSLALHKPKITMKETIEPSKYEIIRGTKETYIEQMGSEPRAYKTLKTEIVGEDIIKPSELLKFEKIKDLPERELAIRMTKTTGEGISTSISRGKGVATIEKPSIFKGTQLSLKGEKLLSISKPRDYQLKETKMWEELSSGRVSPVEGFKTVETGMKPLTREQLKILETKRKDITTEEFMSSADPIFQKMGIETSKLDIQLQAEHSFYGQYPGKVDPMITGYYTGSKIRVKKSGHLLSDLATLGHEVGHAAKVKGQGTRGTLTEGVVSEASAMRTESEMMLMINKLYGTSIKPNIRSQYRGAREISPIHYYGSKISDILPSARQIKPEFKFVPEKVQISSSELIELPYEFPTKVTSIRGEVIGEITKVPESNIYEAGYRQATFKTYALKEPTTRIVDLSKIKRLPDPDIPIEIIPRSWFEPKATKSKLTKKYDAKAGKYDTSQYDAFGTESSISSKFKTELSSRIKPKTKSDIFAEQILKEIAGAKTVKYTKSKIPMTTYIAPYAVMGLLAKKQVIAKPKIDKKVISSNVIDRYISSMDEIIIPDTAQIPRYDQAYEDVQIPIFEEVYENAYPPYDKPRPPPKPPVIPPVDVVPPRIIPPPPRFPKHKDKKAEKKQLQKYYEGTHWLQVNPISALEEIMSGKKRKK